jgi:hypothetical protein
MRNLIERGVNPNAVPGLLQELAERAQRGIQLAPNLNIAPLQRNTGGTYGFVPGRGFVFAPNPMSSRELQEALARMQAEELQRQYELRALARRSMPIGAGQQGAGPFNQSAVVASGASLPLTRQQRAAATSAARAAAVSAARKVTPATITKLPQGVKGPGFTPFKGTDFNIRDNVYAAARSGRLRTVNDIKRAASNIENATFRAKVIAKAQRLALAAIRAGR